MTRLLIIVLLGWPAGLEASPVAASDEEQAEIQTYIDKANQAVDYRKEECAESSNVEYCNAMTKKLEYERDMGISHDTLGNPSRSPTQADLKKISGGWKFWDDRRGEYAKATKVYNEAQRESAENYAEAIRRTILYYNIQPDPKWQNGAPVVSGAPWTVGKNLIWKPEFSVKPQPDEVGDPEGAFEGHPGFLREDGAIIIRPTAFKYPGYLASILRHEELHVFDAWTENLDLRNEPATEVRHRLRVLTDEDVYELSPHDWKQDLKNLVWQNDLSAQWDNVMKAGKDPFLAEDRKQFFNNLTITPEREREIDDQVERDLNHLSEAGETLEDMENVKVAAESRFLRELDNKSLLGLVNGWKNARELEKERQEAAWQKMIDDYRQEVVWYEFEPILDSNGLDIGFRSPDLADYEYTSTMSLEEAKMPLFLAAACLYRGFAPDFSRQNEPRLAKVIGRINDRWADPDFRSMIQLNSNSGPQEDCLRHLSDNIKAPFDLKSLKKTLSKYWEDWDKGALRRLKDYERAKRREEEAEDRRQEEEARRIRRENRPEKEERESRGGGGRYDGPCGNGGSVCGGNGPRFP